MLNALIVLINGYIARIKAIIGYILSIISIIGMILEHNNSIVVI